MERRNQKDSVVLRVVMGGASRLLIVNSAALIYNFESYGFPLAIVASAVGACVGIGTAESVNEFYQGACKSAVKIRGRLRLRGIPLDDRI